VPNKLYSIRDLFANWTITKRTLILCLLWFTASLSSFANDLNSPTLAGDLYLNQILFAIMIALSKVVRHRLCHLGSFSTYIFVHFQAIFFLDSFVPQFSRRALHQIPQACVVVCFAAMMLISIFGVVSDLNMPLPGRPKTLI
jgi:hypothetical protein